MPEAPLAFSSPYAWIYWGVYLWAFSISSLKMTREAKSRSKEGIVAGESARGMGVVLLGLQASAAVLTWFRIGMFPESAWQALFWAGLALMVAGSLLRRHCYRMLGPHFTPEVRVLAGQPVVDRGAYARLRHPGYLASLLMLTGMALALASWPGLLLVALGSLAIFLRRIHFEEKALSTHLGAAYTEFAARRKRLIPGVY
jgi:protein-S-isoprenylcysteine O-methyltransferase Ste14